MIQAAGNLTSPLELYASPVFIQIFDEHLDSLKTQRARANYRKCVEDFLSFLGKDFFEAQHSNVRAYFDTLIGENKKSQIKRLSILRAIARRCDATCGSSLLTAFTDVTAATLDNYVKITDLPTTYELGKVLHHLRRYEEEQLFAIVSLALETGLSTDEICSLARKNFFYDPSGQRFIILEGESLNVPDRFIPLKDATAELIEKIGAKDKDATGDEPLFKNHRGGPLTERVLQIYLHRACEEAGVKPFGIAKCRSLAIAYMMAAGAPVSSLSYQLNVTDRWFYRYNEVVKDLKTSAVGMNPLSADAISGLSFELSGKEAE